MHHIYIKSAPIIKLNKLYSSKSFIEHIARDNHPCQEQILPAPQKLPSCSFPITTPYILPKGNHYPDF